MALDWSKYNKAVILGSPCSGKTTLAKALSLKLNLKHIELDSLFWEKNWKEAEPEVFNKRVEEAISCGKWVIDGNYSRLKDITWKNADLIIWLDIPLFIVLKRFFLRSISRSLKKEVLWDDCIENFRNNIFSKNSLLIWIITHFHKYRREYLNLMNEPHYSNIKFIRLKNSIEVNNFLNSCESK